MRPGVEYFAAIRCNGLGELGHKAVLGGMDQRIHYRATQHPYPAMAYYFMDCHPHSALRRCDVVGHQIDGVSLGIVDTLRMLVYRLGRTQRAQVEFVRDFLDRLHDDDTLEAMPACAQLGGGLLDGFDGLRGGVARLFYMACKRRIITLDGLLCLVPQFLIPAFQQLKLGGLLWQVASRKVGRRILCGKCVVRNVGQLDCLRIRRHLTDVVWLGELFDQIGNLVAQFRAHVIQRCLGILYRVMRPGGGQHFLGMRHGAQDVHHALRVHDVRLIGELAALVNLAVVLLGESLGLLHQLRVGMVFSVPLHFRFKLFGFLDLVGHFLSELKLCASAAFVRADLRLCIQDGFAQLFRLAFHAGQRIRGAHGQSHRIIIRVAANDCTIFAQLHFQPDVIAEHLAVVVAVDFADDLDGHARHFANNLDTFLGGISIGLELGQQGFSPFLALGVCRLASLGGELVAGQVLHLTGHFLGARQLALRDFDRILRPDNLLRQPHARLFMRAVQTLVAVNIRLQPGQPDGALVPCGHGGCHLELSCLGYILKPAHRRIAG